MNTVDATQQLTQLLTNPEVSGSYWLPLSGPGKDTASLLCKELLLKNELSLALPKSLLRTYINRDLTGEKITPINQVVKENNTYRKYGGLDIYAFVEMEIIPVKTNGILIQEKLPEVIEYSSDTPKIKCWELMDSLPFIFKAIIDYARRYSLLNFQVNITNFRFHLVDYRNYGYYICTKQCLDKIFKAQC